MWYNAVTTCQREHGISFAKATIRVAREQGINPPKVESLLGFGAQAKELERQKAKRETRNDVADRLAKHIAEEKNLPYKQAAEEAAKARPDLFSDMLPAFAERRNGK